MESKRDTAFQISWRHSFSNQIHGKQKRRRSRVRFSLIMKNPPNFSLPDIKKSSPNHKPKKVNSFLSSAILFLVFLHLSTHSFLRFSKFSLVFLAILVGFDLTYYIIYLYRI
uniref:Transmembrane protein n=1 Tax=Cacopsylla melanoneura TaxID=428564 RepID=A0A8D9E0E8_9HEMI